MFLPIESMSPFKLYEILIPSDWPLEWHRSWDAEVIKLVGGLTLMPRQQGRWQTNNIELMIPVRIACTQLQMANVAAFTKQHYKQQSVLYYVISKEVYFT